jgi:hypothetical protein
MNKPRKYYSSIIKRLKQEIPREISERNAHWMDSIVKVQKLNEKETL